MPIGKKSGKIDSPVYKGGQFPSDLPARTSPGKGTVSPTGLGMAKNPPAANLASPKRPTGFASPSKGYAGPGTSGPSKGGSKPPMPTD